MGHGFLGSQARTSHAFPTISRTFIAGCICLTKNIGFFTRWGIYIFFLCPTHVFFMLCNHGTHFGRCPFIELTTHSPRMMNDYNHAHTPDSMRCTHAYAMQNANACISCYMYNEHYMEQFINCTSCQVPWIIISNAHNLHLFMLIYLNTHKSTYFQHIQHAIQFPAITHQKQSTQD